MNHMKKLPAVREYLLVGETKRQGYFQSFDVVQHVSGGKLFKITRSDFANRQMADDPNGHIPVFQRQQF